MTAKVTYLPGVKVPESAVEPESPAGKAESASAPLPSVWWKDERVPAGSADTSGSSGHDRADVSIDDGDEVDEPMSEGERAAFLENIVVRALGRKGLSEWEVSKLLTTNGVEEHELEGFLERYRANRYVDDFDLAQTLVESLHRRKGFGRSQIKAELNARHIQPEIVAAALEALDDDDELQRAIELAEKRAPSLARLDAATAERRLTSFLMRKGYPSGIIREAVARALSPQPRGVRFR